MRQKALLFVLTVSLSGADLLACGDKFLVASRGTRFQRGPEPGRGYSVLVYAPPTSPLGDARHRASVEKTLSRAGYKPSTAASSGDLAESLKSGPPDVVVASAGDARDVELSLGRPPGTIVVLKSSMSATSVLDAVDDAVRRLARVSVPAPHP